LRLEEDGELLLRCVSKQKWSRVFAQWRILRTAVSLTNQRVENLEKDRDALLQSMSEMVPGALDDLDGEEKNRLYQMLRLEVTPSEEGYEVS
jgi:hypothetical protein